MENNPTLNMDAGAVEQQHPLPSSCPAVNSQGNMFAGVLSSVQGSYVAVDDKRPFFGYGVGFPGQGDIPKQSLLAGDLRNGFLGLISEMERSSVEAKMGFGLEGSLYQGPNWINQQPPKKTVKKALGKCKARSEGENLKQRKPRQTASKVSPANNKPGPFIEGSKKSAAKSSNVGKEISNKNKEKRDTLIEGKLAEPGMVSGTSVDDDDLSKEEAAHEYQQCVSLLQKYGVLKTHEFYLSQDYPSCAQHPGYVGDGLVPKECKVCGAVEDGKNTVICDECQEVFHMPCCLPRLTYRHFYREDDWYCSSCRKQKKKTGRFNSFRLSENGFIDQSGNVYSPATTYSSKVRLGPAHQADVPLWMGKVEDNVQNTSRLRPGMESPLSQDEKDGELERVSKAFRHTFNWLPAKSLPSGTPENWLQCQNVFIKAFRDQHGHKHREVVCGKWRRAPINVKQSDHWECFCVIEWDPLHADCSVPQELSTEEVLQRIQAKSPSDHEVCDRTGTS